MKAKTIWLGEMEVLGYPVVIVTAQSMEFAKRKLLAEHRRAHRNAKTGVRARNWEHLSEELTEATVRELPLGKIVWP